MKVKFYGTRGSIPVSGSEYLEFGGNTSCIKVTIKDDSRIGILDAGTGIRVLGNEIASQNFHQSEILIGFTHFHWDHIQGLPFFAPAFNPEQRLIIMALGKGRKIRDLKDVFAAQMRKKYFPLRIDNMGAKFEFVQPDKTGHEVRGTRVTAIRHKHPGGAYSYRFERNNKVFVYCTDIEHGNKIKTKIVDFCRGADLLIHDAQYTKEELETRKGWGHSSYDQAIEVAEIAEVKELVMTHHDPDHDDHFLAEREKECQTRFSNSFLAREGMEVDL